MLGLGKASFDEDNCLIYRLHLLDTDLSGQAALRLGFALYGKTQLLDLLSESCINRNLSKIQTSPI